MRKTLAVAAVFVATLAPAGPAFAGETGNGNAWGNCKNSAAGGVKTLIDGGRAGNGLGGFSVGDASDCRPTGGGGSGGSIGLE